MVCLIGFGVRGLFQATEVWRGVGGGEGQVKLTEFYLMALFGFVLYRTNRLQNKKSPAV